ncbi:MAG: malate dehydrogenase [Halofilum sp. (in: g-proteobacteria)]|nr:malate dehydrogenase [Halofilum sp. (in: g-proteobacteria)]
MDKIAVVGGAGRVGESAALYLMQQSLCREVVVVDIAEGPAKGAALDIAETAPVYGSDVKVWGTSDYADMKGADLIIVTAGLPRKPGMSRSDLLDKNVAIMDGIADAAVEHAPDAMMIVVANPVDVMTYRAWQRTGWPRHRVFGQAGVLDSSRMACFLAEATGCSLADIDAMVLGGHGDQMVPMMRYTTVNGVPVENFLEKDKIAEIIDRTRKGGAEVLQLRENSSAYLAPGASTVEMVDSVVHDRGRILPCVAILDGEYGHSDCAMGVPSVLTRKGLEKVVELDLTDEERDEFEVSLDSVRADLERLK